jgi:hypothetical protein
VDAVRVRLTRVDQLLDLGDRDPPTIAASGLKFLAERL